MAAFTYNGQNVDMANPQDVARVFTSLNQTIQGLQTQVQLGMTRDQMTALIQALPHRTQAVAHAAPVNDALSTPNTQVLHEDNPPPQGSIDNKCKLPEPFLGKRHEAEDFVKKFEAYITLRPNAMRLTRTRILVFCPLLQVEPAKTWGNHVLKAITDKDGNSNFYYDNWAQFKATFFKNFGLINKQEHAMNRFQRFEQGNTGWETFFISFDQLRQDAGLSKDQAFWRLKKATNKTLRITLMTSETPPRTYDDWVTKAAERTRAQREIKDFENQRAFDPASMHQSSHQSRQTLDYGTPMDIDSMRDKRKLPQKGKVPSSKGQLKGMPPKKPPGSLPSRNPSKTIPTSSGPSKLSRGTCFRCGKPGHMVRDCTETIRNINEQHVASLVEIAVAINGDDYGEIPVGEDSDPQEEDSTLYKDDNYQNEEEELLITFNDEQSF